MNKSVDNKMIIKNTSVLRYNGDIQSADIVIENDKIAFIGHVVNANVLAGHVKNLKIIDGKGKLAIPGFINAHTHASMTLLRSFADDKKLMDWLRTGTTAFADMYGPCMDEVAKVVEESGLRGVLSRGLIGVVDGYKKLAENVELFKNFHNTADGRIQVMFGPHAIYTCPPDYLRKVAEAAAELGSEIHIHMNETLDEVNGCIKDYGKRPFEVVNETGLFDMGTLAAHCVHLSDNEIEIMKEKNIRVAHNPGSNMKLASGIAPVCRLMDEGITVALGTDGASSNNNLDMLEEVKLAALLHKVDSLNPVAIPALEAIRLGTENGAKAIGLKDVGRIEKDYKADIVLYDMKDIQWQPRYNPISLLVYSANSSSVDTVIVDGKILMEHGELKTLDEEKIIFNFNQCFNRLTGYYV